MQSIKLDLSSVKSEDEFHDLVKDVFGFPYYYGRNLDAFWDCLSEIAIPTKVEVFNLSEVSDAINGVVLIYVDLLRARQEEVGVGFNVLVL